MSKGVFRKAGGIQEKVGLNALRKASKNLFKSGIELLNNDTHCWRLLGTKNAKGEVMPATLLSALPGNNAATKGNTVAAEYVTCEDQTKNELNMCANTAAYHRTQGGMAAREIGAAAMIRQRAFAGRAATAVAGLILGDTKKKGEYDTGTMNDGIASAPFGKLPRRYGYDITSTIRYT